VTAAAAEARASRFPRAALAVVLVASLIQVVVAARGPLDGDESLYWEWSRHLAGGYFDHPPGVAYLIRLGVDLFGVNAFGVRFGTLLANLLGSLLVVKLAQRHGGRRAALRAALILACMPIMQNWLMLATPDSALFLAAMAVLYFVDNALGQPTGSRASLRWWLLAGVALGLAALSKELAILVPMGVVVACLTHRELRPRLLEAGPYLACLATAILIIPLVLWNREHDWILLRFALERGLGAERGTAASRELEYLGGQGALVSPLLFLLLGGAVIGALRGRRLPRLHLLAVSSLVTFGWFALTSLRHPTEVNWGMMAYPPAAVVLAVRTHRIGPKRWLAGGLLLGGALVLLLHLHTVVPVLPIDPLDDPIRRGHGWDEVAAEVDLARIRLDAGVVWVAGNRFQDASQLAFHLERHPFVFSLNIHSRANQYDFWPSFAKQALPGDGLVLVLDDSAETSVARELMPYFGRVTAGARVVPGGNRPTLVPKRIWLLDCWLGKWPTLNRPGGKLFADPTTAVDSSAGQLPFRCRGAKP
jgi:hypothetical protein